MDIATMKKAMPLGNSPLANKKKSSKRKAASKESSKPSKSSKTSSKSSSKSSSSSSFAYPETPMPAPSLVKSIYESNNSTGRVKIDVAIAAICQSENAALKSYQAAVQKKGDESGKDAVQRAR